jgi:type III secretory pathway component EscU
VSYSLQPVSAKNIRALAKYLHLFGGQPIYNTTQGCVSSIFTIQKPFLDLAVGEKNASALIEALAATLIPLTEKHIATSIDGMKQQMPVEVHYNKTHELYKITLAGAYRTFPIHSVNAALEKNTADAKPNKGI